MAKQLNVNLAFTADTARAKQQLDDLQKTLSKLVTNPSSSGSFSKELAEASRHAAELSAHLKAATNQNTGMLDFSKLNQSIQQSGKSLSAYGEQLLKLGPEGQTAFKNLATAVANSEIPIRRINASLAQMGTVLKNTIRWQISSSALHGFMGAIQGAYGYAQNLNESLNNIRIVTGQNISQMEKFATTANKAAKALSTSTLDYTNASLIYYQQGLSDEEVKKRTDVTIKMANAAGASAEQVSQQLTAVWNNYAKGADNLEYFADVMTALGAATASSTDEIAEGLEKFASVGETVGLSYEYATAALATVTATTRQSADVVGNAFKTLFARLEGLKLGETLEDGTDLNKYSQALNAVGVNIKDTNGDMKDMDTILDELAAKWQALGKDQQMALAQTVAGVRQYTQLVALMNNWDFMQENVKVAQEASGTLQKQADIYAESWEAAQKRVQAAWQTIYQDLIDDKFFITILDGTEKALEGVHNLIEAFGGLPGVLSTIGALITTVFGKQLSTELSNIGYSIMMMTPQGQQKVQQNRQNVLQNFKDQMTHGDYETNEDIARQESITAEIDLQSKLTEKASEYNAIQLEVRQQLLDQVKAKNELLVASSKELDLAKEEVSNLVFASKSKIYEFQKKSQASSDKKEKNVEDDMTIFNKEFAALSQLSKTQVTLKNLREEFKQLSDEGKDTSEIIKRINDEVKKLQETQSTVNIDLQPNASLEMVENELAKVNVEIQELRESSVENIGITIADPEKAEKLNMALDHQNQAIYTNTQNREASTEVTKNANQALDENIITNLSWSDTIVAGAQLATSYATALNSIIGIIDVWNNEDMSGPEKLLSILTSFGMVLPLILRSFDSFNKITLILTTIIKGSTTASVIDTAAKTEEAVATEGAAQAQSHLNKEMAANPIVLGVIATIMLAIGALTLITKHLEKVREQHKEAAEEVNKEVKALQEQIKTNNELNNSYETAYKNWQKTKTGKEALAEAALKVAEAYEIENRQILIAQGRYDELNDKIDEARQKELKEARRKNENALVANSAIFEDDMRRDTGHFGINNYIADFGFGFETRNDRIGQKYLKQALDSTDSQYFSESRYGNFHLETGKDTDSMLAGYEEVQNVLNDALQKAEEAGQLAEFKASDHYRNISDWLAKSSDAYNTIKDLKDANIDFDIQEKITEITKAEGDIDSAEDFIKVQNHLIEELKEIPGAADKANKAVKAYMKSNANYAEYAQLAELASGVSNQTFGRLSTEDLLTYYNSLSSSEQAIFWQIDFDKVKSKANLDKALNELQTVADYTAVETTIGQVDVAQSKLKKNMSESDYKTYEKESTLDWGNAEKGIVEYNQFLAMTYEEQVQYLENLSEKAQEKSLELLPKILSEQEQELTKMQADYDDAVYQLANNTQGMMSDVRKYYENLVASAPQKIENLQNKIKENEATLDLKLAINNSQYYEALNTLLNGDKFSIGAELSSEEASVIKTLGLNDIEQYLSPNGDGTYSLLVSGAQLQGDLKDSLFNQLSTDTRSSMELLNRTYFTPDDDSEYQQYTSTMNDLQSRTSMSDEEWERKKIALLKYTDSIKDLNALYEEGIITDGELTAKFNQLNAAMEMKDLDGQEIEDYAKYLQGLDAEANDLPETLKDSNRAAEVFAKSVLRMSNGVEKLADDFAEWNDILHHSEKDSDEYRKALEKTINATSDLLDTNEDFIDSGFLDRDTKEGAANLALLEKAASGDEKAIDQLRINYANFTAEVESANLKSIFEEVGDALKVAFGDNATTFDTLQGQYDQLLQHFRENGTLDPLDTTDFTEGLNQLLAAGAITAKEVNKIFDSMGMEADVENTEVDMSTSVPQYKTITHHSRDGNLLDYLSGNYTETTWTETIPMDPEEVKGQLVAPSMDVVGEGGTPKPKKPQIKNVSVKATGSKNNYSSKNAGGKAPGKSSSSSSSASKAAERKQYDSKRNDIERYKEITDAINDLSDAISDANKQEDRLYGPDRLKNLEKQNQLIKQQTELFKEKKRQAVDWLDKDKTSVNNALESLKSDVSFKDKNGAFNFTDVFDFDEAGNITNYTSILTDLWSEYDRRQVYWADPANFADKDAQDNYEKDWLKPFADKISKIQEAIKQYDETNQLIEDLDNSLTDFFNQGQDITYSKFQHKLEIRAQLDENNIKFIESRLNALGDNFYKRVEAAGLLAQEFGVNNNAWALVRENQDFDISRIQGLLSNRQNDKRELDALYAEQEISQEQYLSSIQGNYETTLENISEIVSLNDQMKEYYANTISQMNEEIEWHTKGFDNLAKKLEHYNNLLNLTGQAKNFEKIGAILDGQLHVAQDVLKVDQERQKLAQRQYNEISATYASLAGEAKAAYEETFKAASNQLDEMNAKVMEDINQIAEYAKSKLENTLEEIYTKSAQELTNDLGYDYLSQLMDLSSTRQDEYLTTTNQIYETNKLMRLLAQDIDKTDSAAAKSKLAAFKDEIADMQKMDELSNYQLEDAKLRYEILKAQIALEEAQNQKTTMRLMRDASGNYNYVYTANPNDLADRQQALEDAQNNRYNLALQTQNENQSKRLTSYQSFTEAMQDLDNQFLDGSIATEEELNRRKQEIREYYWPIILAYEENCNNSAKVLNEIGAVGSSEAWAHAYDGMIADSDEWSKQIDTDTKAVQKAMENWSDTLETVVEPAISGNYGDMKDAINDVAKAADDLEQEMTGPEGLLADADKVAQDIQTITDAWIKQYKAIQDVIKGLQKLAQEQSKDIYENIHSTVDYDTVDYSNKMLDTLYYDKNGVANLNWNSLMDYSGSRDAKISSDSFYNQYWDSYNIRAALADMQGLPKEQVEERLEYLRSLLGSKDGIAKYFSKYKSDLARYDTGGYTGIWGSDGKFALLHQKELVLNADDTENFLAGIEILRQITDAIDLRAAAYMGATNLASPFFNESNQTLQQDVTIHAEFPNVTNHTEIEEAFDNLINKAAQYAAERG